MPESHLSEDGTSSDLALIPKANNTADSQRGSGRDSDDRPWIRTGLATLPPELIHGICSRLCRCCHSDPAPYTLTEHHNLVGNLSGLARDRMALHALSTTCRFLYAISQPYLFHSPSRIPLNLLKRFDPRNTYQDGTSDWFPGANAQNFVKAFLGRRMTRTSQELFDHLVKRPHIINQVRRLDLNSVADNLLFLRRLTGLSELRLIAQQTGAGGIGLENYLSFPCLRELHYVPVHHTRSVVRLEDARKDLRAILAAAPNLSTLRCSRLWHDVSLSPFVLLKLPACNITSLELRECWLPHGTFKRFLANFTRLKNFKIGRTRYPNLLKSAGISGLEPRLPKDGPGRIADAIDGEFSSEQYLKPRWWAKNAMVFSLFFHFFFFPPWIHIFKY
jgi:hypothetical protein